MRLKELLIIIFMMVLLVILLVLAPGCRVFQPNITTPIVAPSASASVILQSLQSTNWAMSLFLVGFVASLAAAFNGLKMGWGAAAACVSGLLLKNALAQTWIYVMLGLLLVGAIGLFAASVLFKNRALVEIITGVQRLKSDVTRSVSMNRVLKDEQSKPTQRIVGMIKTDLKVKEKV